MAKALTWRDVAAHVQTLPRGSKSKLASAIGMDPSFLLRKLKGADELTTGQALAFEAFTSGEDVGAKLQAEATAERRRLPFFGYAAASSGDRVALNPGQVIEWMDVPFELPNNGEYFGVIVAGDSMEPRLFSGERLVVRRNASPIRDRDALIEFQDGSGVVKIYRGQRDHQVIAYQLNTEGEVRYDGASVKAIHNIYCRL